MPWNGSGAFIRSYNWTDEANAGENIRADHMDGEDDNFATGITACLAKNGENAAAANLPMAGFRHTNVGNAVNRNEYLVVGQYQDGWGVYCGVTAGTDTAYTVDATPNITAYVEGMRFLVEFDQECGDDPTLNINGVGDRNLMVNGVQPKATQIKAGIIYVVIFNDSEWQVYAPTMNNFLSLDDVDETTYVDKKLQQVVVNDDEDGLVFGNPFHGVKSSGLQGTDPNSYPGVSNEKIDMSTVDYDTDGFKTAPADFTIPVGYAGVYRVSAMLVFDSANWVSNIYIAKNGFLRSNAIHAYGFVYGSGYSGFFSLQTTIDLAEGDILSLCIYCNSINTQTLEWTNGKSYEMSMELIGILPAP